LGRGYLAERPARCNAAVQAVQATSAAS